MQTFNFNRNSLSHHFFLNTITFFLLFIKFHRNRHFFKLNSLIYNKYWSLFFVINISVFTLSGCAFMGLEFFEKYYKNIKYIQELYRNAKYKSL